jgi:hypothetical protein
MRGTVETEDTETHRFSPRPSSPSGSRSRERETEKLALLRFQRLAYHPDRSLGEPTISDYSGSLAMCARRWRGGFRRP